MKKTPSRKTLRLRWKKILVKMEEMGVEPTDQQQDKFLGDHDAAPGESWSAIIMQENGLDPTGLCQALAKACIDSPFDYACRLRTGEVIAFSGAKLLRDGWIELTLKPLSDQPVINRIAFPAERGLEVRVADIVWIMDAPNGS